jgi:hypothetical protein
MDLLHLSIDMIHRRLGDDIDGNNITIDGKTDDFKTDDHFDPTDNRQPDHDHDQDPTQKDPDDETDGTASQQAKIGFAVMTILVAISVCGMYQCYICFRRRQQRRMMESANDRADHVLGDMVMIPTSFNEYDDDDDDDIGMEGELI